MLSFSFVISTTNLYWPGSGLSSKSHLIMLLPFFNPSMPSLNFWLVVLLEMPKSMSNGPFIFMEASSSTVTAKGLPATRILLPLLSSLICLKVITGFTIFSSVAVLGFGITLGFACAETTCSFVGGTFALVVTTF